MNIVDSSCWLEFFAGTAVGEEVAAIIEDGKHLIVPVITLYEVFKKLLVEVGEDKAIMAIAHMKCGNVIDLDADLSIFAAKTGKEHALPLADSIIYAHCIKYSCTLWTKDKHFLGLPSVRYLGR